MKPTTGAGHAGRSGTREAPPGNVQKIKEIYVDCDNDTVLFKVEQVGGAACHTGYETCFHKQVGRDREITIVGERIFDPERVYGK